LQNNYREFNECEKFHRAFERKVHTFLTWTPACWIGWYLDTYHPAQDITSESSDCQDEDSEFDDQQKENAENVVEKISKRHKLVRDVSDNQFKKFVPTFELETSGPVVDYCPDIVIEDRHNGQLKLLSAFLACLDLMENKGGFNLLFVGAAPGYAINMFASAIGCNIYCVDDYPVFNTEGTQYYSFQELSDINFLSGVEMDMVFIDTWESSETDEERFLYSVGILERYPNAVFSIKRFASLTGVNSKIVGSTFIPLVFSKATSLECREMGRVAEVCHVEKAYRVADALRRFQQEDRLGVKSHNVYTNCSCYDCSVLDYYLVSVLRSYPNFLQQRLIGIVDEVADGSYSSIEPWMVYQIQYSLSQGTFCQSGMNGMAKCETFHFNWSLADTYDGMFAYMQFDRSSIAYYNKLVANVDGMDTLTDVYIERVLSDPRNMKTFFRGGRIDPRCPEKWNCFDKLRSSSTIERFYRPPRIAEFVDEQGSMVFRQAIPLVKLTVKDNVVLYATPQSPKPMSFSVGDIGYQPSCFRCGYAEEDFRVDLRSYLAVFQPDSYECSKCGVFAHINYLRISSIDEVD
jgi:hypothetical protein